MALLAASRENTTRKKDEREEYLCMRCGHLKKTFAGKMDVVFIDVWEDPDAGKKYGINMIPTQIFYDAAGKELFRHEGVFGKDDILAKWKELGVSL